MIRPSCYFRLVKLVLPERDPYVEVTLEADAEVDRAAYDRFTAIGGSIRYNGFKLTVDGVPEVPARRRGFRRGDISRAVRRR